MLIPNHVKTAIATGLAMGLALGLLAFAAAPALREWTLLALAPPRPVQTAADLETRAATDMIRRIASLSRRLDRLTPRAPYLIIDTSSDRYSVKVGDTLLREGLCSTGSYILLQTADERQWIFRTPRGMFRIQGKVEAPVWRKPDWAFVEEGLVIPAPHAAERFEAGVLGDYALSFGRGYLIHGTLYKRFLGMPVTHGCVRMDDDDLHYVYAHLSLGSRLFIY